MVSRHTIISAAVVAVTVVGTAGLTGYHCTPHRDIDTDRLVRVVDYNMFGSDTSFMRHTNLTDGITAYSFNFDENMCVDGKIRSGHILSPFGLMKSYSVMEPGNGKTDYVSTPDGVKECSKVENEALCRRCDDNMNENKLEHNL